VVDHPDAGGELFRLHVFEQEAACSGA